MSFIDRFCISQLPLIAYMIQTINFPFPKVFIVVCPDMSVMSINQSESLATMKRDTTINCDTKEGEKFQLLK